MIQDYLDGPDIITHVLIRRIQEELGTEIELKAAESENSVRTKVETDERQSKPRGMGTSRVWKI